MIRSKGLRLGHASCLALHWEDKILRFIFDFQEQGMAVLVSTVLAVKVAQTSHEFVVKLRQAKYTNPCLSFALVKQILMLCKLPWGKHSRNLPYYNLREWKVLAFLAGWRVTVGVVICKRAPKLCSMIVVWLWSPLVHNDAVCLCLEMTVTGAYGGQELISLELGVLCMK